MICLLQAFLAAMVTLPVQNEKFPLAAKVKI